MGDEGGGGKRSGEGVHLGNRGVGKVAEGRGVITQAAI